MSLRTWWLRPSFGPDRDRSLTTLKQRQWKDIKPRYMVKDEEEDDE